MKRVLLGLRKAIVRRGVKGEVAIPLMKKGGYPPHLAGAIEAHICQGQLKGPISQII
jgi:TRAP-type uncharacterized transport system fused permease subunit